MSSPEERTFDGDSDIRQLVAACFDEADQFARGVFAKALSDNPDDASEIKRQYQALSASGLIGYSAFEGPTPDPWEEGARAQHRDQVSSQKLGKIGPYQLLRELGRGGQAAVYLAEDMRLHRPVALKVLKSLGPLSETVIRRFRREAEVASKLDHPGICSVYDAGVVDDVPYIAMRFVKGWTLCDRIEKVKESAGKGGSYSIGSTTRDDIYRVLAIIEKTARALHVAHEAGIVHRDVKPGNIIVTGDTEPVLLDFGLAGDESDGSMSLTASGDMMGTPAYMSPEQLISKHQRLDRRTDIYSLGATLFECLTLQRPFRGGTREAMYQAIQYKDPADIRSLNAGLPIDLKVVVETALEKDRDKRYQTAEDFADDLKRIRENEPVAARPISAFGRAWRWACRRPVRAALLVVVLLGMPALTSLAAYLFVNQTAIQEAEKQALHEEIESYLEAGFSESAFKKPNQAVIAFDKVLSLKPQSPEATVGKGLAFLRAKKFEECLSFITAQPDASESSWPRNQLRILALRNLGRNGEADDLASRSIAKPRSAVEFFLAGSVLLHTSATTTDKVNFAETVHMTRRAILSATGARLLYYLQLAHAASLLDESSKEARDQVAESLALLWPESARAMVYAGIAWSNIESAKSENAYRQAIKLNREWGLSYANFMSLLSSQGRWNEAVAIAKSMIRHVSDVTQTYLAIGLLCHNLGLNELAQHYIQEHMRTLPAGSDDTASSFEKTKRDRRPEADAFELFLRNNLK